MHEKLMLHKHNLYKPYKRDYYFSIQIIRIIRIYYLKNRLFCRKVICKFTYTSQ